LLSVYVQIIKPTATVKKSGHNDNKKNGGMFRRFKYDSLAN
jgi:hypothetical protein